uniref:WD repeat-containing protein 7 n=1 Tax=Lepeophtheirus salmonis TaxID=72036 RepID=A0A0K2TM39_LEPSM
MTSTSSLVVPLIMWGRSPPSHCISSITVLHENKTLATGGQDGEIILWDMDHNWNLTPRHLLVGHSSGIRCLTKTGQYLVSASENGELNLWDPVDGSCIESKKYPHLVHSWVQSYRSPANNRVKLFSCGLYEEIVAFDSTSLEVLFQLSSRVNPDWISSFHVLRPPNRKDDVVLALTTSGTVKVWTLTGNEESSEQSVLENESKQIRCVNSVRLSCCAYNMRTVLIVCSKYWNIYDAGDFTCLLTMHCRKGERWSGGEFVSGDRVCIWSDDGKAYIYKLPTNCIVESKDFHNKSKESSKSVLLHKLEAKEKALHCPPAFDFFKIVRKDKSLKFLLSGDCDGCVSIWNISDISGSDENTKGLLPIKTTSLEEKWKGLSECPLGILGQLGNDAPEITSTIFLPMQCRLVCGRDDGSIVMVPATQTIMLHLLSGRHQKYSNWPHQQMLIGHSGRVNCLLYPNNDHPRYDVSYLVSGSVDFSVCLWDIYTGTLLHTFSSHGGEVMSLYVPPPTCSPRIQHCICSVASDNSVTLLSLKERRCVMLASRHLYPVTTIKWRPFDDFLIVGCSDGTTYVWQMETGHLDRVVHGHSGDEILAACDENAPTINIGESVGANPALHFFRGLRHRNLAAMKIATQTGMSQIQQGQRGNAHAAIQEKNRSYPLIVNGFRTNPKNFESHILFFDVEALIVQLLSEEYQTMTPGTMETQGFTNQKDYDRIWALTKPASPDTVKKISGFLNKVKDKADDRLNSISSSASPETQRKLTGFMSKVKEGAEKAKGELEHAKREIEKRAGALDESGLNIKNEEDSENGVIRPSSLHLEINLTLEIGQLLLSLLHAWGLDKDLDKVATSKLGLLRPKVPVSFGILSKGGGVMSLSLPTYHLGDTSVKDNAYNTQFFTSMGHWELSHTLTTNHLLSVISITNTLISVSNASFIPEQERKRKLVRQATHGAMELPAGEDSSVFSHQQEQIQQGWSLLSTLHCFLIPEKLKTSISFKKPLVELLAIRWQDRCLQVRLAAQELLVAELKNMGLEGRKKLVEVWGLYLPKYGDPPFQPSTTPTTNGQENNVLEEDDEDFYEDEKDDAAVEARRNQTTSVILLGVIGALFDIDGSKNSEHALGSNMIRLTAKALMYLVLCPKGDGNFGSNKAGGSTSALRRAAIDLIARGFCLWEPHLEVSKVLLSLLEMCSEADWWVPSTKYGLPLTPSGDSCRTSRHALMQIAKARPGAFVTSIAREISRFNNLAANSQSLNVNLNQHVLTRSKAEILHLIEVLIETNKQDLIDLLVNVTDIALHCIDGNHLKNKCMGDIFPPISYFPQISHCMQTRRLAVGTKTGSLVMYDLRASKLQSIPAHSGSIIAVSFSPDGKNLATFSDSDNKLHFWQTSTGMFGLGNAQTRCTKSYNVNPSSKSSQWTPNHMPKLVWNGFKTVTLLLPDGAESRFNS